LESKSIKMKRSFKCFDLTRLESEDSDKRIRTDSNSTASDLCDMELSFDRNLSLETSASDKKSKKLVPASLDLDTIEFTFVFERDDFVCGSSRKFKRSPLSSSGNERSVSK
jgi:hypothetical protein